MTLDTVASLAGVSRATVSRVVNGSPNVDTNIRREVEWAIRATGYEPSRAARSLVTRRAGAIALVLPDSQWMQPDPFVAQIAAGVTEVARAEDVQLVLIIAGPDVDRRILADARQGRLDGVILVHVHEQDPLPARLIERNIPLVMSGRPDTPLPVTYVDVDHDSAAALVADHLVRRGARRTGTICPSGESRAERDRLNGFVRAMRGHGRGDVAVVRADHTRYGGAAGMRDLLRRYPDLDSVFVTSEQMAQGALSVLRDSGRSVPEDVAVVGFDDSAAALACEPSLTTVHQPVEEMAAQMTRMLLRQIAGEDVPASPVIFESSLIVRRSS